MGLSWRKVLTRWKKEPLRVEVKPLFALLQPVTSVTAKQSRKTSRRARSLMVATNHCGGHRGDSAAKHALTKPVESVWVTKTAKLAFSNTSAPRLNYGPHLNAYIEKRRERDNGRTAYRLEVEKCAWTHYPAAAFGLL